MRQALPQPRNSIHWNLRHWLATGLIAGWLSFSQDAAQADLTPTGDVPEATGWATEIIAEGLTHPWAIAWLPEGGALITERPGRLRHLRADGVLDPRPISGLPDICSDCGQGGLLDLALHPAFADNRLVYFTFAAGDEDANATALARGRFKAGRLSDVQILYRNPDDKRGGQHFGSRLVWLPDGSLLMSIGDGGNPPIAFEGENIRDQAQQLGTVFGKVIRLDENGGIPSDNPFVGQADVRPEIFSYGHRNIQGMVWDPVTETLWASEHGSRGGDELNRLRPGANYGWPSVTYSREYWGPRISDHETAPEVINPIVVWTPSIAPSGLAVYQGEAFPQWRGDLFAGALKFRQIRRLRLDDAGGDTEVEAQDKLSIGQRVRDLRTGPDGELYLLTDEADGALLKLVPTSTNG